MKLPVVNRWMGERIRVAAEATIDAVNSGEIDRAGFPIMERCEQAISFMVPRPETYDNEEQAAFEYGVLVGGAAAIVYGSIPSKKELDDVGRVE